MQEFFNIDISHLSIFIFLGMIFWGVILYGFLWLLNNYLILLLIKSPVKRQRIMVVLPPVNVLVWLLFGLYWLYVLVRPFPFLGVALILVFAYLSRGYLLNLVHGLFFRFKRDISLGQEISFGSRQGNVIALKNFDFEIQNKEGEIIQVPYGAMINEHITKKDFSSDFSSHKFTITAPSIISEQELNKKLNQSPWVSQVFQPQITLISAKNEQCTYDIIVYLIDSSYQYNIEKEIRYYLQNSI